MEGLIFALVIMALGAFFNGKNKEETEASDKPKRVTPAHGERGQRTFKRVEDYARDVYGDLQNQMKDNTGRAKGAVAQAEKMADRLPERERTRAKQAAERGRKAVDKVQRRETERPPRPPSPSSGRLSVHQEIGSPRIGQESQAEPDFSLEPEALKKAIVMAEILLPPKSKR